MLFEKDTLLLENTIIHRLSVSTENHCWAIAENDHKTVIEIGSSDQLVDHTTPIQTLTSSYFTDIQTASNGVVFIGTYDDYLVKYQGGSFSRIEQANGLLNKYINSLIWTNKPGYSSYHSDPWLNGIVVGTGKGWFYTQDYSTMSQRYLGDSAFVVHGNTGGSVTLASNEDVDSRCTMHDNFSNFLIGGVGVYENSFSTYYSQEDDSILTFISVPPYYDNPGLSHLYWGTKNGLRKRAWVCLVGTTIEQSLPGVAVHKIFELKYNKQEILLNYDPGNSHLLVGTEQGLYYHSRKPYQDYYIDSLIFIPETAGYKIYDIDVDTCNSRVWLATDKGILRLFINRINPHPFLHHSLTPAGEQRVCAGTPVNIQANTSASYQYQWLKNNSPIVPAAASNYSATGYGAYRVVYTYNDYCKTYTDTSEVLNILPDTFVCAPPAFPDTLKLCDQETTLLQTTCDASKYTHDWYKDHVLLNNKENTLSVSASGIYSVKVTNCNQYVKTSDSVIVVYTVLPQSPIGLSDIEPLCEGDSVLLSVTAGNYQIDWFKNEEELITNKDKTTYMAHQSAKYSVTLRKETCSRDLPKVPLLFYEISKVKIVTNKSVHLCDGQEIILTANNQSNDYFWSTQEVSKSITVNSENWYTVNSYDLHHCYSTDSIFINRVPIPVINLGEDTTFCEAYRKPILLTLPSEYIEYNWNGFVTDNNVYEAFYPGQYIVKVKDDNHCIGSDTLIVYNDCPEVFIPNLITPNGDGLNDEFVIKGSFPGSTLHIYNRYGEQVYQADDYKNDWNSGSLSSGVYYYEFISDYYDRSWKGWLHIVK